MNNVSFRLLGEWVNQKYERYLPSAFDDSLSMLEKINKLIEFLNEVIRNYNSFGAEIEATVNGQNVKIQEIFEDVEAFKQLVTTQLIPENLEALLNEWYADGTLGDIINTEVFNNKRDKDVAIGMNDLDTEVKTALVGGAVNIPIVGEDSVGTENVKRRAINQDKISYFTTDGKNMFNQYAISKDMYIGTSGELVSGAYHTSDFMSRTPNKTIVTSHALRFVAFYDSTQTFISRIENVAKGGTFVTPANTSFIRISFVPTIPLGELQIEENYFSSAYEQYHFLDSEVLKPNSINGEKYLLDSSVTEDKMSFFRKSTKNLLNPYTLKPNYFVNASNGTLSYATSLLYDLYEYVDVTQNTSYVAHMSVRSIAFYDSNKVFLSGITTTTPANTSFTTPPNAHYMTLNIIQEGQSGGIPRELRQLEQGSIPTSFEPYFLFDARLPDGSVTPQMLSQPNGGATNSQWQGKNAIMGGDSIVWQDGKVYSGTQNVARGYQTIIKERLGLSTFVNVGVSGRPIADGTANGVGTVTTMTDIDYTPYHLTVVAGGTNDAKLDVPLGVLGSIGDTVFDRNTFYGAYRTLVEHILTSNRETRLVLFTPLQRDNGGLDVNTVNGAGHKLLDYVNAIIEIGEMYSLPVVDMYRNSGVTKKTLPTYTSDGLHLIDPGYERAGGYGAGTINML